jgi:hypothetical protein
MAIHSAMKKWPYKRPPDSTENSRSHLVHMTCDPPDVDFKHGNAWTFLSFLTGFLVFYCRPQIGLNDN